MAKCIIWELTDGRVVQSFLNPLIDFDKALERTREELADEYGPLMIPHIADTDDLPDPDSFPEWQWSKITNRVEIQG